MNAKISIILLFIVNLIFAKDLKLRSDIFFRPVKILDFFALNTDVLQQIPISESDYLNELSQTLSEYNGDPISLINSYAKSKYTQNILTFGFKIKGNTTLETLFLNDSTGIIFST
jgi:hypothetical protein